MKWFFVLASLVLGAPNASAEVLRHLDPDAVSVIDDFALEGGGYVFGADTKRTALSADNITFVPDKWCADGGQLLRYKLDPPDPEFTRPTQKIMHRLVQERPDRQRFNQIRSTTMEFVAPSGPALEPPEGNTLIFQVWQGAPFRPPLSVRLIDADEETVTIDVTITTEVRVRDRRRLAEFKAPRDVCVELTVVVQPSHLDAKEDGMVALRVRHFDRDAGVWREQFGGRWITRFGFEPENPRGLYPRRCIRLPKTKCCKASEGQTRCLPNRRFQTLVGLYREVEPTSVELLFGSIRVEDGDVLRQEF